MVRSPVTLRRLPLWLAGFFLLVLLSACGGSVGDYSTSGSTASSPARVPEANSNSDQSLSNAGGNKSAPGSNQKSISATALGPQYLIKTLKVSLGVKDTKKAADAIQSWINTTDPRSSSVNVDYQKVSTDSYMIAMTFSVQAEMYPQVYRYLRDYTQQNGGNLLGFNEQVQNVTNDYVDSQARLKNLRAEQDRLLTLMSNAKALGDILSIEQRLTDVQGQLEQIEAQIKSLNDQTTFYTVALSLQPIYTPPPDKPEPAWNPGKVFADAFDALLTIGKGLLTVVIWLLVFSIYILPIAVGLWFLRRWFLRTRPATPPPTTSTTSA